MDRILRKGGAERTGADAADALGEILEKYGEEVAERAVTYADHADRKTVQREDVELAVESLK